MIDFFLALDLPYWSYFALAFFTAFVCGRCLRHILIKMF